MPKLPTPEFPKKRAAFLTAGGEHFHYLPCLNEDPLWIKALADLTERHLSGWPLQSAAPDTLVRQAARAKTLGALE